MVFSVSSIDRQLSDLDPDLQGVWASDSATPFERPKPLADRELLTDEEVALLRQRATELFNGETDAAFGDRVYEAVLNEAKNYKSTDTTCNYNQFWLIDRWFENRTSLIVDPPDGRMPPLTPEGEGQTGGQRRETRRRPRAVRATGRARGFQCGPALHRRPHPHDGEGLQQQLSDRAGSGVCRDQHGDGPRAYATLRIPLQPRASLRLAGRTRRGRAPATRPQR